MKFLTTLILVAFLCVNCNKREEGVTYDKQYYKSGELKYIVPINEDSLAQGKVYKFSKDGDTISIVKYIDGEKHGVKKKYYKNGNLKYKLHYKKDRADGKFKRYFKNGNIAVNTSYDNGKMHGKYLRYYESGNIRQKGKHNHGVLDGYFKTYFDSSKKILSGIDKFKNGKNVEHKLYKKDGTLDSSKTHFFIEVQHDSLSLNSSQHLKVNILSPVYDSTKLVVGAFDEDFNIVDSSSLDTFKTTKHEFKYPLESSDKGKNVVRGYLWHYELKNKVKDSVEKKYESFPKFYFEKEFYVE